MENGMTNIYGDFNGDMLKAQQRQAAALESIAEHLGKISVVLGRATEKPDTDDNENLPDGIGYDLRRGWVQEGELPQLSAVGQFVWGAYVPAKGKKVGSEDLYREYLAWSGTNSFSKMAFLDELRKLGLTVTLRAGYANTWIVWGIEPMAAYK